MSNGHRIIGQRVRRLDAGPRLTGRERYTADLSLPGMLHARLVLSTQPHARITAIHRDDALSVPGVVSVVTAADLPGFTRNDDQTVREHFFLAHQRVSYVGEQVAVVLAESPEAALAGAERVRVEYEPLPPVIDLEAALSPDAPVLRSNATSNVSGERRYQRGNIDAAFREAYATVEGELSTETLYQSYLEPRAVLAEADPLGRVTIYTPTQGQFTMRQFVAEALRMSEADVVIRPMTVGGGFGAKFVLFEPLVALLAIQCGRPVKLVLDRTDDFTATINAPQSRFKLALAADSQGKLTAIRAEASFDTGYFAHSPYDLSALMLGSWYPAPNLDIVTREVYTNRPGAAAYRAPGLPQTAFALEQMIDDLAGKLGIDPLEFRLRNVARTGDPMADGTAWLPQELYRLIESAREHPLWTAPKEEGEGVGCAIGMMGGTTEPASASARLIEGGSLQVTVGSIDLTGTNTGLAQIAAETFGLPLESVRVTTAPSDIAPHSGGTGGSKILYTVGNAVIRAVEDAKQQALAVAAGELEVSPVDLEIIDGVIRVIGSPDRTMAIADVVRLTTGRGARHAPIHGQGNVANAIGTPRVTVHLARVKVNRETGEIVVTGYAALHDVGKAINPAEVEGQIYGGIAQGFGWALYEALRYDPTGQPITASFMDYALPRATQIPSPEPLIFEYPSPHGPFGARGIAEPPVIPTAAAIANALYNATGVRMRSLPMTAERVWRALQQEGDVSSRHTTGG